MLDSERDGTRETELRRDRDEGAIKSPQGGLAKGLPRPKGNRILKKNANLTESTQSPGRLFSPRARSCSHIHASGLGSGTKMELIVLKTRRPICTHSTESLPPCALLF